MYSDSSEVVDALADCLEYLLSSSRRISPSAVEQTRLLMDHPPSVEAFAKTVSVEQLKEIELKEQSELVAELTSAIGLQRFRFGERQSRGKEEYILYSSILCCFIIL